MKRHGIFLLAFLLGGCLQNEPSGIETQVKSQAKKNDEAPTVPMPAENENKPLPKLKNARLVVKKKERRLEVFDNEKLVKTYKIALGFAPVGDKEREGDGKTPEGEFYVFTKNDKSRFYLSIGLSYPNEEDARRGLRENLISQAEHDEILKAVAEKRMPPQKTALGGEIYIHGGGRAGDWTRGCVALTNEEIKELFEAIPVGASVRIES